MIVLTSIFRIISWVIQEQVLCTASYTRLVVAVLSSLSYSDYAGGLQHVDGSLHKAGE